MSHQEDDLTEDLDETVEEAADETGESETSEAAPAPKKKMNGNALIWVGAVLAGVIYYAITIMGGGDGAQQGGAMTEVKPPVEASQQASTETAQTDDNAVSDDGATTGETPAEGAGAQSSGVDSQLSLPDAVTTPEVSGIGAMEMPARPEFTMPEMPVAPTGAPQTPPPDEGAALPPPDMSGTGSAEEMKIPPAVDPAKTAGSMENQNDLSAAPAVASPQLRAVPGDLPLAETPPVAQDPALSAETPKTVDNSGLEKRLSALEETVKALEGRMTEESVHASAPAKNLGAGQVGGMKEAAGEDVGVKKAPVKAKAKKKVASVAWVLKSAKPGEAWLLNPANQQLRKASPGETVEGLGRILSVGKEADGRWHVRGSKDSLSR